MFYLIRDSTLVIGVNLTMKKIVHVNFTCGKIIIVISHAQLISHLSHTHTAVAVISLWLH